MHSSLKHTCAVLYNACCLLWKRRVLCTSGILTGSNIGLRDALPPFSSILFYTLFYTMLYTMFHALHINHRYDQSIAAVAGSTCNIFLLGMNSVRVALPPLFCFTRIAVRSCSLRVAYCVLLVIVFVAVVASVNFECSLNLKPAPPSSHPPTPRAMCTCAHIHTHTHTHAHTRTHRCTSSRSCCGTSASAF
jgi:hypothetical protein